MKKGNHTPDRFGNGFTILETIGVLSILAILAALLLPPIIGRVNRASADTEMKSLRAIGEALERQILAEGVIPDSDGWISMVAEDLAVSEDRAARSLAGNPRILLVDPDFGFGAEPASLPWIQDPAGSPVPPENARVLILSSQGWPLPDLDGESLEERREIFEELWDLADDTVPEGWPAEWTGEGESLLIHRLDLARLFHRLAISIVAPGHFPEMTVGNSDPFSVPGSGMSSWFLEGSLIGLYRNGLLDFREVVTGDRSYFLEQGGWRGQLVEGRNDDAVLDAFFAADLHPSTPAGATQYTLADAYYQYGLAWGAWSGAGFPTILPEGGAAPEYVSVGNAWVRLNEISAALLLK